MKMNFWYYLCNFFGFSIIKLGKHKYPICPECGQRSIVLFAPPKETARNSEVNWDIAHIYCCNGRSNCKINTLIKDLTTPIKERFR